MSHKRALLLALLFVACSGGRAILPVETTRRYTVLMTTNTAGTQVVTTRGNEVVVDFEYNDRGRGPKTHTVIRLDERSLPVFLETRGNDYLKQPVEERFVVENGVAKWKNTAESGEAPAGALYASMYGPPEESGILARALMKNGGSLALLPGGRGNARKAGEMTLRGTRVTAYEISGFGLSPFEVWLDDDMQFFATVSSWFTTIREGFEGDLKTLLDAQDARKRERDRMLAQKLTRRPAGDRLVVTNARVFDPRTGGIADGLTIEVEGNRIVRVTRGTAVDAKGEIIDARGKTVLPGLWDMHVHVDETDAMLHIASGVTSVRDLANDSDSVLALKQKIENGEAIGPRIVLVGIVDGPGPFQGPTNQLAAIEEDAKKVIDFYAGRGYEGLKIYSSVKPELVPFMTRYAHSKGMRVSGHIPAGMTATQAVDAGYDEIQHANMLFLNFMPDVTDTRTPARFTAVAERGADLDLSSAEVRAFIEKLKSRNVVVDPTVTIFESMFTARAGVPSPSFAMIADRLPPQMRRGLLTGGLPVPEGKDERYRASFRRMLDLVKALHDAGVPVVAGTDNIAGFTLHRELELYVQAGLRPAEVLRLATLVPAQILKRDQDLGTIEPGKLADFIIIDGDPTTNISDVRRVVTVVKDGKVFDAAEVYAALGVR